MKLQVGGDGETGHHRQRERRGRRPRRPGRGRRRGRRHDDRVQCPLPGGRADERRRRAVRARAQRAAVAGRLQADRRRPVRARRDAGPDDVLGGGQSARSTAAHALPATSAGTPRSTPLRPGPAARLGPERRRQDQPARGDRPARLGPLAPDEHGRRADPLGRGPRARRGPRRRDDARDRRSSRAGRRPGTGGRKRIRVNGVGAPRERRSAATCGSSCSPRRRCSSSPGRRRCAGRRSTSSRPRGSPAYADDLATYGRALQQRNGLLRAIREEARHATSCGSGTRRSSMPGGGDRGGAPRAARASSPTPLAAAHARDRARRGGRRRARPALRDERAGTRPASRRGTPSPAGSPRPPRRRSGTARRSSGRTATTSPSSSAAATWRASRRAASSGPRSSRFKLAELDLLTALDGRPPLLLLDDVFCELDPERRVAPRPADRRPAAGVRDHDDARRPGSGAARDRDALGGRARPAGAGCARRPARRRDGALA